MIQGECSEIASPTASYWFVLRRWYRRSPLAGWLTVLALMAGASVLVFAVGRHSPAPFLPYYPAIMLAALLGGRQLGYAAVLAALAGSAWYLQIEPVGARVPYLLVLCLSGMVGTLVVEILSRLVGLAEALRAREAVLAARTAALLEEEARLTAALSELEALYDEAPIGLGLLDRELRFVRINAALAEINGFTAEDHIGRHVWDLLPDLRASAEPMLRQVLERNEAIRGVQLSGETPAKPGVQRDWREMFYPVHGPDGAVLGVGIFCEEVTEAKRASERERLLSREVDHRAKNLLTVIQSVLKLTRSTGSVEEFKEAVSGRIQSLGRVHTLLAQNRWEGVQLGELIRQELAPFGHAVQQTATCHDVRLPPSVAQAISMILHELATNSLKHGALSRTGRVLFACGIEPDAESPARPATITLSWREEGGPPVGPMQGNGFGTSLIQTAVKGMLGGELDYQLRPEGLDCTIRFPLIVPAG